jgi:hypothetical protein
MSHPFTSWVLIPSESISSTSTAPSSFSPGVDFQLDENGDLDIVSDLVFTTGLRAVAQGIRLRLQMFFGEWFQNLDLGIPYLERPGTTAAQAILGQKYNQLKTKTIFRKAIADAPGVDEILYLNVDFNRATRVLSVDWKVQTSFGQIQDGLGV